ncbi:MAG: hypothetical protein ACLFUI_02845 [Halanaerobiales bacterium]
MKVDVCNLGDRLYSFIDSIKKVLPLIITAFSLIYFIITYKFFWLAAYTVSGNTGVGNSNYIKSVFSTELLFVIRACLFYFIPIFTFTVLLYFIFVTWKKFKIGAGKYSIELEAEDALSIVGRESSAIVEESLANLDFQYNIIAEFNQEIVDNDYTLEKLFELFILHLKEIFNSRFHKLDFVLNFIPRTRKKLILLNLYGLLTIQNDTLNDIILESAEEGSCFYLDIDEETGYKQLIASPIFDNESGVFSVVIILTKHSKILTETDTYLVRILCQMFSIAISKFDVSLKTENDLRDFIDKIYEFRIEN